RGDKLCWATLRIDHGGTNQAEWSPRCVRREYPADQSRRDAAVLDLALPLRGWARTPERAVGATRSDAHAGAAQRGPAAQPRGLALRVRPPPTRGAGRRRVPPGDGAARPGLPQLLPPRGAEEEGSLPPARLDQCKPGGR